MEVTEYEVIFRDMTCEHNEEADNIIESSHGVSIISDDTDDSDVLVLYYFQEQAR